MNDSLLKKGILFIKKNPAIIYSLLLIIAVTAVVFLNAYYSLGKFQKATDSILQSKAVLIEDIFGILIAENFGDQPFLQKKIEEIKNQDDEIKKVQIIAPVVGSMEFVVLASSEKEEIGKKSASQLLSLAWSEAAGIANLQSGATGRFWNVSKTVINQQGEKIGIVSLDISLVKEDAFIREELKRAYLAVIISVFIVLLFVVSHVRMFRYVLKAAKLEEVDKMKDDFISAASHELQSPLTAAKGYVDLLEAELTDKSEQQKYVANLKTLIDNQIGLVGDLLEVSRIEQGRARIIPENIELPILVDKVVEEMKIVAENKGLILDFKKENTAAVFADPQRVKQIIRNLISNAVKYTPSGKVEVKIAKEKKFVAVMVEDSGIGISAEDMEKLFSKFYRAQTDETLKISGTGLGLWLSRELAQKMGGNLTAESIRGKGSRFVLKLIKTQTNEQK